jgi:hypothetical protein
MLGLDDALAAAVVELAAAIESLARRGGLADLAQVAREVEEDLDLDAAASFPLVLAGSIEGLGPVSQGLRGLARTVESLEAVAFAKEAEVVAGKCLERLVVPEESASPALLPLEEPADLTAVERGAARVQLRAAEEVALDLGVVVDERVGAGDLLNELDVVPGRAAFLVDCAVAAEDPMDLAALAKRADLGQGGARGSVGFYGRPPMILRPATRIAPVASSWSAAG